MEEKGESLKRHSLPYWRQLKIASKACEFFFGLLEKGAHDILPRAMEKLGIVPIPYSQVSKNKKDRQLYFSEYGYLAPPINGIHLFFFNEEQGAAELRKTSWHEVGHVVLGHTQESALAEAEADFFMECSTLLEANKENLLEVMPMIRKIKSA